MPRPTPHPDHPPQSWVITTTPRGVHRLANTAEEWFGERDLTSLTFSQAAALAGFVAVRRAELAGRIQALEVPGGFVLIDLPNASWVDDKPGRSEAERVWDQIGMIASAPEITIRVLDEPPESQCIVWGLSVQPPEAAILTTYRFTREGLQDL